MAKLYKLINPVKNYEWGSFDMIPSFLGIPSDGLKPWAEMWMGNGSGAYSITDAREECAELRNAAGADVSFLFKLLAAEKPLSIQAHPNKEQAEWGFLREETAGIALTDPRRNYKDNNHKPEIICAVTPFTAMAGFRTENEIKKNLGFFLSAPEPQREVFSLLLDALEDGGLLGFFRSLFGLCAGRLKAVSLFFHENENPRAIPLFENKNGQWELMRVFADMYPADPAVISPLFLNLFTLEPGQAIYIPAGILHSYVKGFGVELMANSDNVLRGGLTPKHVDADELINILDFCSFMPRIITPDPSLTYFNFPSACGEFSLSLLKNNVGGGRKKFPVSGPAICVVMDGEINFYIGGMTCAAFKKGGSFFINQEQDQIFYDGNFSLYAASGVSGV